MSNDNDFLDVALLRQRLHPEGYNDLEQLKSVQLRWPLTEEAKVFLLDWIDTLSKQEIEQDE